MVAMLMAATPLAAQEGAGNAGSQAAGALASETVTATVAAIDPEQRIVTLQGPERTIDLPVSAAVDLASVQVGDRVALIADPSGAARRA
jgi:Cu/Ag efflux protein CusF